MSIPRISIQKWTAEGPAYTIHRNLSGRRNRKLRRAGVDPDQLVGPHFEGEAEGDDAFLLYTEGDTEVWGFPQGGVWELELLLDGAADEDATTVHIDAREEHAIETFPHAVQLLGRRLLTDDEVAELTGQAPPEEAPAAPEAPLEENPPAADADEESTGDDDYPESIPVFLENAGTLPDEDILHYSTDDSRKGIREAAAAELERRTAASTDNEDDVAGGSDGNSGDDEEE